MSGTKHMAQVIVAESRIHGLGVFATRSFTQGEIILAIDDLARR